ncbi:hypothetical protein E4U14_007244 [Claviceps sp. LM454 group G7]|nr:hypothetical protein E4U14_007244 [Claviceps sp. LM454 group G7]
MRGSAMLAVLLLGIASATSLPHVLRDNEVGFTVVRAGHDEDIIVAERNTLNTTSHQDEPMPVDKFVGSAEPMTLEFINNFSGGPLKAYIQGLDFQGKIVFIRSDGSLYYPPTAGASLTPIEINNERIAIDLPSRGGKMRTRLPIPVQSGRVYFSEGPLRFSMVKTSQGDGLVQPSVANAADPSAETNWGFVEFTYTTQGVIYANISYVDFVGMILSMSLKAKNSARAQLTRGLRGGAVQSICNDLGRQLPDGKWKPLCVVNRAGKPIRVLSPNIYTVMNPGHFQDYWQGYVDRVWQQFSNKDLTIDTQGSAGKVKCRVRGDQMMCDGDNRSYGKPSAKDIWGCDSGTFAKQTTDNNVHLAVIARLCAAFNRSTLLLAGGDVQPKLPATSYYTTNPTNKYSYLVHQHEVDGKGYAFSYDDVNPNGENASGSLSTASPETLTIYVGEPPS